MTQQLAEAVARVTAATDSPRYRGAFPGGDRAVILVTDARLLLAEVDALQRWQATRVSAREASDAEYLCLIMALRGLFNEIKRLGIGHEGSELLEVMCDARRALDRCDVSRPCPDAASAAETA